MRRLIIALVAVDLMSEATKLAGRCLAQRRRENDYLTAARAYNEGISRAMLIAYGRTCPPSEEPTT